MAEIIQEMIKEAKRIEEDSEHSAKGQYNAADRWNGYHLLIGIPASVVAALAGVSVVQKAPSWAVACAVASAALTTVLTFLRPSERSEKHKTYGGQYLALRNAARIFRQIEVVEADVNAAKQRLLSLSRMRDELNQTALAVGRKDYELAKTDIDSGRSQYGVDGAGHVGK